VTRPPAPPFDPTAIAWLVGLTAGSFVLAIVWTGIAGDLAEPRTAGTDSYSTSALGHRAFAELLQRSGLRVERRRTHYTSSLTDTSALILAEPPELAEVSVEGKSLRHLYAAASRHGTPVVVVLPKRSGQMDPSHPRWVAATDLLGLPVVTAQAKWLGVRDPVIVRRNRSTWACSTAWGERLIVSAPSLQLLAPSPDLVPIVSCDGLLLVARHAPVAGTQARSPGPLPPKFYVVSDPDLINTFGLGRLDNADVVRGLLVYQLRARTAVFDETLHFPAVATGLLTELFRFPLVFAVAQAALLLGFVLWASVARFGKAREAAARDASQRALVDSIAGLLAGTGRPADTLEAYLGQVLRDTGTRYGLPATLPRSQLTVRLAGLARSRRVRGDIEQLSTASDRLQVEAGRRSQAVVRTARDIHHWYEDMNHDG